MMLIVDGTQTWYDKVLGFSFDPLTRSQVRLDVWWTKDSNIVAEGNQETVTKAFENAFKSQFELVADVDEIEDDFWSFKPPTFV